MVIFGRIPDYIQNKYLSWKSDSTFGRKFWLQRTQKAEEYYYNDVDDTGTTYTSTQYWRIKENTNLPFSVNFLHPVCNQKLAILSQTKPSLRVVSVDGRAKLEAEVLDKMKHGVFYNSNSQIEIESTIKDMLISGMGHIMVVPTDFYQPGMFNTAIVNVPYDEVILDINSKKRTLEDMEGFFIEKAFTFPKLAALYGNILSQLIDPDTGQPVDPHTFSGATWIEGELTEKGDVTTTNWNADDRVIVREYYEKVFTTMYTVTDPETGINRYMFAENLDAGGQTLLADAKASTPGIYVKKTVMFGDFTVWDEILPISEYPLKTVFFEWGGRPYRSYGMPHFTIGMQEAYDKLLSLMVMNGILSNNAGWTAPKGSIAEEDRKKWEEAGNNPQVIKEWQVKIAADGKVYQPEKDKIEQLGNFYPMMLDMLKGGIEYSTGITPILQGNAKDSGVEVFSSLQQYQNAAMMRIILATSHINEMLRQLGQILIEYMAANLTPNDYQFFDEKGNLSEFKMAVGVVNNIKDYKYKVVAIPSTAMPTQRLATATELMKIAQSSPDPVERQVLTQKAMELSDIKEFEDVTQQLDAVKNSQKKLSALQEAYNRLMETSKQMENKYINISLENRILKQLSQRQSKIAGKFGQLESKMEIANKIANKQIQGEQKPVNSK